MSELLVFDPAMCRSTGVCGPEVFNLGAEPQSFMRNALVRETLQREGTACLPLVVPGGEVVSRGCYLSREELAG